MTSIKEIFLNSKNWSLFTNMTHSKNWTLMNLFIWHKELDFFRHDSKSCLLLFLNNMTRRIEPSFWTCHNELKNDAKNWTSLFSNMTQRIEFFPKWLKVLNFFFLKMWLKRIELCKYDSENWTFPFFNTTHRIKDWCFFFFSIWLKELNMIQSIEPSFSIWL